MSLIHMFKKHTNKDGYVRATVIIKNVDFLLNLGFSKSLDEAISAKPDEGLGKVTSLKFLVASINDQRTKKGIVELLEKAIDLSIPTRSSLKDLKEKAVELLEENYVEEG